MNIKLLSQLYEARQGSWVNFGCFYYLIVLKLLEKIFYIWVVFPTFEGYFNEDDFSRIQ